MFSKRWGIGVGAHFFWEGFRTNADVKNYYTWVKQGDNVIKGYYTGTSNTSTEMWGVTVPLFATFRICPRWNLSFGPYLSYYFKQTFKGEAICGRVRPSAQRLRRIARIPCLIPRIWPTTCSP